jgi:hypothetical protein
MNLNVHDLYKAARNADINAIDKFLGKIYGGCLNESAHGGHIELVKYWIGTGFITYNDGNIALCTAAARGHLNICEYLVELGFCEYGGHFSLDECCEMGYIDIAKYFFGLGYAPDYYIMNNAGEYDNYEIFQFFIASQPKRFVYSYLQIKLPSKNISPNSQDKKFRYYLQNKKAIDQRDWELFVEPSIPIIGKKILATNSLVKHNILKIVLRPKSLRMQMILIA